MNVKEFTLKFILIGLACAYTSNAQDVELIPEADDIVAEVAGDLHDDTASVAELTAEAKPAIPDAESLVPYAQELDASTTIAERLSVNTDKAWRFEAGLRSLRMDLSNDKQGEPFNGSFIGSINELKVDQQYMPVHPYFQALKSFDEFLLGVGLSYDSWTVATEDGGGGDGNVEMDAWTIYLVGRVVADSKFHPFAELGWAMYNNDFDPDPIWYAGGRRNFVFDDAAGLHLAAGCDYLITDSWSANIYLRYVDIELDGSYIFRGDSRPPEPFVFPMEHVAYGLGLSYTF